MTPVRRRCGWLVTLTLLLHGWLPVVLGAALGAEEGAQRPVAGVFICSVTRAAAASRSTPVPVCPVTHDSICLCAIFVGCLSPESGPAVAPPMPVRAARLARPVPAPARALPVASFEARAPPAFG